MKKEEFIELTLINDYLSAYRNNSWVPIDVVVRNTQRDVEGSVEIKVFVNDEVQSPIYRVPASSPKGSTKRFRLYCHLSQATRVQAMLYHGNRPALEVPAYMQVQPIGSDDLLFLILDEEGMDYNFLPMLLMSGTEARMHRQLIRTDSLFDLPDYPQCYDSYDAVIMGKSNPNKISEHHRELLRQYVAKGGKFIACMGDNAKFYKDTWVEELLQVRIGSTDLMAETDAANIVFDASEREGARTDWQCLFTSLGSDNPWLKFYGREKPFAVQAPVGAGYAYALGVDMSSRALQGCQGFKKAWKDIMGFASGREDLNYGDACAFFMTTAPRYVGVTIQPKSVILRYLLAYFFIAVVLNWFVFNWLKRRELFWVTLMLFSFGFTTYAVIFGTAGRAKTTEMEEIRILKFPEGSSYATEESFFGILTAKSQRYAFDFISPDTLIRDVQGVQFSRFNYQYGNQGSRQNQDETFFKPDPFFYVQASRSRVEDFAIGASELRFLHVSGLQELPGTISGSVTMPSPSEIACQVHNNTGWRLKNVSLVYDGGRFTFDSSEGNVWSLRKEFTSAQSLDLLDNNSFQNLRGLGYMGGPSQPPQDTSTDLDTLRDQILLNLMRSKEYDQQTGRPKVLRGPYLLASVDGPVKEATGTREFIFENEMNKNISETLLVARLEVTEQTRRIIPFEVRFAHLPDSGQINITQELAKSESRDFIDKVEPSHKLLLSSGEWVMGKSALETSGDSRPIKITVIQNPARKPVRLEPIPMAATYSQYVHIGAEGSYMAAEQGPKPECTLVETETSETYSKQVFLLKNWPPYVAKVGKNCFTLLDIKTEDGDNIDKNTRLEVQAEIDLTEEVKKEEMTGWQSFERKT